MLIGRAEPEPNEDEARLRALRVESARRNATHWTEILEVDLARRGRFLVHAETDAIYRPYRGVIFARDEARPSFNENVSMEFYVSKDGVAFLERVPGTWSEHVARRARRAAA
jgi:hypothetical protein